MAFNIKQQKDTNVLDEVTATSVLTDNAIVRGDGGAKGVQTSPVFIGDDGTTTIPNNVWVRFVDYAGTGYINAFKGTTGCFFSIKCRHNRSRRRCRSYYSL